MFGFRNPTALNPADALPGRQDPVLRMPFTHRIFGRPVDVDVPDAEVGYFAMGCFWGAEKLFWNTPGVVSTAVGYMGGHTPNPTYQEVCSGRTGHTETVRVVFDPARVSYRDLLAIFFENHDPTQGNRQGNDVGTQYRSAIFTTSDDQRASAEDVRARFQQALTSAGYRTVTTTIDPAHQWYHAEAYHQQYLDANPNGYCPIHATGVTCRPS